VSTPDHDQPPGAENTARPTPCRGGPPTASRPNEDVWRTFISRYFTRCEGGPNFLRRSWIGVVHRDSQRWRVALAAVHVLHESSECLRTPPYKQ
jgi:hypothetical protein